MAVESSARSPAASVCTPMSTRLVGPADEEVATSVRAGATETGRSEVEVEWSERDLEEEAGDHGSVERGGDDGAVEARDCAGEDSEEGEEGDDNGDADDDNDDEAAEGEAGEDEAAQGSGATSSCEGEVGSKGEEGKEGATCSSTTVAATTTEESGSTDRRFFARGGVTSDDEAEVDSRGEVAATSATCSSSSSSWRRLREGPLGDGGVDGAEPTARRGEGVLRREEEGVGAVASVVGAERAEERRAARLYGAALSRALLNLGGIAEECCAMRAVECFDVRELRVEAGAIQA